MSQSQIESASADVPKDSSMDPSDLLATLQERLQQNINKKDLN